MYSKDSCFSLRAYSSYERAYTMGSPLPHRPKSDKYQINIKFYIKILNINNKWDKWYEGILIERNS